MIPVGSKIYTQGTGTVSENLPVFSTRDASPSDINYLVGRCWINTLSGNVFYLTSIYVSDGVVWAVWTPVGPAIVPFPVSNAAIAPALIAGQIRVFDSTVLTSSTILLTASVTQGTAGFVEAIINNGNFFIQSTSNDDTSIYQYVVIN